MDRIIGPVKVKEGAPVRLGQGGPVVGKILSAEVKEDGAVYATMEVGGTALRGRVQ